MPNQEHIQLRRLLVKTGQGHNKSAQMLWDLYASRLIAYARSLLASQGAQDHAEDVVQIAMCKILQVRAGKLKKIEAVGPWLYTIVRTSALNHMRGERRELKRRAVAKAPASLGPPSSFELLRRAVEALPSDEAEVITLRHAGGLTFEQIAEVLAIPRSTAASRHSRSLERLKNHLSDPSDHDRAEEVAHHA